MRRTAFTNTGRRRRRRRATGRARARERRAADFRAFAAFACHGGWPAGLAHFDQSIKRFQSIRLAAACADQPAVAGRPRWWRCRACKAALCACAHVTVRRGTGCVGGMVGSGIQRNACSHADINPNVCAQLVKAEDGRRTHASVDRSGDAAASGVTSQTHVVRTALLSDRLNISTTATPWRS